MRSALVAQALIWSASIIYAAGAEAASCGLPDDSALLQTYQKTKLHALPETDDDSLLEDTLLDAVDHSPPDAVDSDTAGSAATGSRAACLRSLASHHVTLSGVSTPGTMYLPDPSLCNEDDILMLPQISRAWNSLPDTAEVHKQFGIPPYSCCIIFAACAFIFVFSVIRSVLTIYGTVKDSEVSKYPEADAWARSKVDWLWMGWATQWISRWGTADNSALTKISSSDIPLSDPNDECELCFRKFGKLWKEELARVGEANASLLKVVTRFVTYKKIFAIAFWNAFYEGFMFLGPPMAIKWVTKYLNWLYTQRGLGMTISGSELVLPSLFMMMLFCGLPILMAVSNSMCTMLNGRISIRIDGALSLAVYDKAQRLPVVQDDADDLAIVKSTNKKSGKVDEDKEPEDAEFDSTPADEHEKLWANNGVNKRFNLVQVVTNDINTNLMMIPNSLARMVVMIPVLIGTLCMLVNDIGMAFFFSLAMAIINLALMTSVGLLMRNSLGMFYSTSGKRLQFLQEVLVGIRFVKGCGAEGIVQDRLAKARGIELRSLDTFYTIQCFMFILTLQLPKLYILASLGGYALINHGEVEPTIIMSVIPLLMSVQGAIAVVFSLIPTLVMALPSCRRLETFLKIKEAPRASPIPLEGTERVDPPYVRTSQPDEAPVLRIQGNFSWQSWTEPTLRDIDIIVPQGKLVAVLGAVGSGKTTLLHAILGELFPTGDSRIEVQKRMAYSAQTPHLFEGSLKDNVLIGSEMDTSRYKEAIFSSCLIPDLEMLPGGDEVPVGGRGITLSGGQKARVSMARAAYDTADLVLVDDPFAAVDAHTGRFLNENLLHGPLLRGRTRIVVCQPDSERIPRFDWVIIMSEGRISTQGPAQEVMKTDDYRALMCSATQGVSSEEEPPEKSQNTRKVEVQEVYELREEECEGRASWATMGYFGRMGGWLGISTCIIFYLVKNVLDMKTQVQLSMWMSHGSLYDSGLTVVKPSPWTYILNYIFWMAGSTVAWFICWVGGQSWTLGISEGCHRSMCRALLRAPIDRFYDKTPTGRIMNRMANDMMNVDMQVFVGCCSTIGMIWAMSVPIYYVHLTMPLWFTLLTIPMYYLVVLLISLYWKTMVPLRYLMQVSKSGVSSEIADVENTPSTVRAYGMEDYRLKIFALAVRKMIAADFLGRIICIRWLCNRLFVLGGFFVAGLALLCIWLPSALDVGSASLVINTMFSIIVMIEGNLSTGSMAQYQIIAMNRIYEYTALPEEREEVLPCDSAFQNQSVTIPRATLGELESHDLDGTLQVSRGQNRFRENVLVQQSGRPVFFAAEGKMLADLAPGCQALRGLHKWHRIVSVNGEQKDAKAMVSELCEGDTDDVHLLVESGWLADGVKIEIRNLRAGYADVPQDVLHGISLTIPRYHKAGVVGPTGCGKSTLLLCLLRMLEPRDGTILLEGVDTTSIGLRTLRNALGLVPQDPVLLQGTLRFNIDPFEMYTDERIIEALELVHMKDYVLGLDGGLDFSISGEGANLSFGQRQLLSLARNIVRKPMLLLLDEATSAIDPHTQELLQATIQAAFPNSTMVVIAHRLETILDFDMAIVMDRGRVAEIGDLRELAKTKDGKLAKMLAAKGLSLPPERAEAKVKAVKDSETELVQLSPKTV